MAQGTYRRSTVTGSIFNIVVAGETMATVQPPARSLGERDIVQPLGSSADFATTFVQWYDLDSFNAYLAAAGQFTEAAIDAMPASDPRGQLRAVWGAWENLAMAFSSLNIPMQSWDRFRRAWQAYFGNETYPAPNPNNPDTGSVRVAALAKVKAACERRGAGWLAANFGDPSVLRIGGLPPAWLASRYYPDTSEPWSAGVFAWGRRGKCSLVETPQEDVLESVETGGVWWTGGILAGASPSQGDVDLAIRRSGRCANPTGEAQTFFPYETNRIAFNRYCAEAAMGLVNPHSVNTDTIPAFGGINSNAVGRWWIDDRRTESPGYDVLWDPSGDAGGVILSAATEAPYPLSPGAVGQLYYPTASVPGFQDSHWAYAGTGDRFLGGADDTEAGRLNLYAPSWKRDYWVLRAMGDGRIDPAAPRHAEISYFPSPFTYWALWFMPIAGLRVGGDPEAMFQGEPQPGDLSLVQYMAAVGGDQLVREIRYFTTRSNINESRRAGITTDAQLYGNAERNLLSVVQAEINSATRDDRVIQAIGSILGAGGSAVGNAVGGTGSGSGPSPGAAYGAAIGAVIGAGTSVALLIKKAFEDSPVQRIQRLVENHKKDSFGVLATSSNVDTLQPWGRPFLRFFIATGQVELEEMLNESARILANLTMPNGWPGSASNLREPTGAVIAEPQLLFGAMPFRLASASRPATSSAEREALRNLIESYSRDPMNQWLQSAPGLLRALSAEGMRDSCQTRDGVQTCTRVSTTLGAVRLVGEGWTPAASIASFPWSPEAGVTARLDGITPITGGYIDGVTPGPHTVNLYRGGEQYASIATTVGGGRVSIVAVPNPPSSALWWLLGAGVVGAVAWRMRK